MKVKMCQQRDLMRNNIYVHISPMNLQLLCTKNIFVHLSPQAVIGVMSCQLKTKYLWNKCSHSNANIVWSEAIVCIGWKFGDWIKVRFSKEEHVYIYKKTFTLKENKKNIYIRNTLKKDSIETSPRGYRRNVMNHQSFSLSWILLNIVNHSQPSNFQKKLEP